jgi:hypothetical protein
MKYIKLLLIVLAVITMPKLSAQKFIARNGHVWFFSHTPVEDIEAHNRQVVSILDPANGTIEFSMLIKAFEFEKKLMQEHFNENYMESDKYPKASFSGKINNLKDIDFSKDGDYKALVAGDLTIHDVTRKVDTEGTIRIKSGVPHVTAKFIVNPEDHKITIPAVVKNNIAREIDVNVDVSYTSN